MNLRALEDSLDRLENEIRACQRHGVLEFTREAERCRKREAAIEDPTEQAIWHEAARRIDRAAETERGRALC